MLVANTFWRSWFPTSTIFIALAYSALSESLSLSHNPSTIMRRVAVLLLLGALWHVLTSPLALGYTNEEDVYALNALFSTLNEPPLSGWVASGGDPCSDNWQGVGCVGPNVTLLNLSGANLMGALGYSLENLTTLIVLDLSNNLLSSVVPYQLPPHAQHLILSSNRFTGSLPYSLTDLSNLAILNTSNNMISGEIPDVFVQSTTLSTVDLSNNYFTGQLPPSFGDLRLLSTLYLQNNQLDGTIDVLAPLPLKDLDISNNIFTGWIPASLKGIQRIEYIGNEISTSPAPPPPPPYTPPPFLPTSPPSLGLNNVTGGSNVNGNTTGGHKFMSSGRLAGIAIGAVLGVVTIVVVIMAFPWRRCRCRRDEENIGSGSPRSGSLTSPFESQQQVEPMLANQKDDPLHFFKPPPPPGRIALKPPPPPSRALAIANLRPGDMLSDDSISNMTALPIMNLKQFTIAEIQSATDSFSQQNLIGGKHLGPVYKAGFHTGEVFAIRRLDSARVSNEIFISILSSISQLCNENITKLVGFCDEYGERLLIYEFVNSGTLYDALHSGKRSTPLSWNSRVKIAYGVAKALEYLHEGCRPPLVHQNINSAKILLDEEFSPRVSDCGLAPLFSFSQVPVVEHAPEWSISGCYSDKSDVYSFGVVMLELMTGREPLNRIKRGSELSLVRWAAPQLQYIDALQNMVDPALKGAYSKKQLSYFADVIALCVKPHLELRPPMSVVAQSLQSVMNCEEIGQ